MNSYLNQNQVRKSRTSARIKIYFGFGFSALILILLAYLVIYSPIFQVRSFKITGKNRLSDEAVLKILEPIAVKNKLGIFLGYKNLLSWNTHNPGVSNTALISAGISRDWLRQSININIAERERFAIWCDKNAHCYWIDQEGTAFEEAPKTEGSLILTVNDNEAENLIRGAKVVEERFAKNLTAILKGIAELRLPLKKADFSGKLQELAVESYSGPDYFFSVRFDPALNLESLKSLITKSGLKNVKYFDLRVENRIFYKNF